MDSIAKTDRDVLTDEEIRELKSQDWFMRSPRGLMARAINRIEQLQGRLDFRNRCFANWPLQTVDWSRYPWASEQSPRDAVLSSSLSQGAYPPSFLDKYTHANPLQEGDDGILGVAYRDDVTQPDVQPGGVEWCSCPTKEHRHVLRQECREWAAHNDPLCEWS